MKRLQGIHLAHNAESQKDSIDVPENEANALVVLDTNPGGLAPDQPALTVLFAATTLAPDHEIASVGRAAELDLEDPLEHVIIFVYRTASTPRYILNGGTRHMTTERDVLMDYRAFSTLRRVRGAFSSVGKAIGKGKIALQLSGGTLKLKGVLLTPKLGQTRLMLHGFTLVNTANALTMHDPDGHALATLPVGLNIYVESRPTPSVTHHSKPLALAADADFHRLHCRLGHPSDWLLSRSEGEGVDGPVMVRGIASSCVSRVQAKATQKGVAKTSDARAVHEQERLSTDTWGPAPVVGLKGEKYVIVLVDGTTRYAFLSPVTTRGAIPSLVSHELTQLDRCERIVAFQSDNGSEFINATIDGYLARAGIQHRCLVPYIHGQSSFVEHRWRTLLNSTVHCSRAWTS